jgi:hypothetical protein
VIFEHFSQQSFGFGQPRISGKSIGGPQRNGMMRMAGHLPGILFPHYSALRSFARPSVDLMILMATP